MTDGADDELRELARRALDELGAAAGGIGALHHAIAHRAFRSCGPVALAPHALHDGIAAGVYAAVGGGARALARVAARALPDAEVSTAPRGALLLGVINGLIGDELEREGSRLAQPMSVRIEGRPVPVEPDALAAAFGGAGGRAVVFLHGLMETEFAWWLAAGQTGGTYGSRLRRDLGWTPVYVRYNTGRRISVNGRELAHLLQRLVDGWPVEVSEIALVGHSMGGLVARSACHYGGEHRCAWTRRVTHTVTLGTPHMGAPLARGVHRLDAALDRLPETRPVAAFLRRRSEGIDDLRHGSLVDEDWAGRDKQDLRAAALAEIPLLAGATHCFVSATITRSPHHPLGRLIGDWLVLHDSAAGRSRTRRIPFDEAYGAHVGGAGHVALLNHPEVYGHLRRWLAAAPRSRQAQADLPRA